MWLKRFASAPSDPAARERRAGLRVGLPKALSLWSTHRFWVGLLRELGIAEDNIVFSSDTSEDQFREYGRGRGTVDSCFPVKCVSGHYGELLFGQKRPIQVLLHPIIHSLPSFMRGHVMDTLTCPRDMAAPENIKAGFLREKDVFAERGVEYLRPFVALGQPELVPHQLQQSLGELFGSDLDEMRRAVDAGYGALETFSAEVRQASRAVLEHCAREQRPCILVLGRPYHMDPGLGHEIEAHLQEYGYPILWNTHLPTDDALLDWLFGAEVRAGDFATPMTIDDVWPSSYSSSTNEIIWGAKFAARMPWITCVVRLSSYECGMDQPTLTPAQRIVEATGTLYFRFGDLDATQALGSVRIRTETIAHYVAEKSADIMARKRALLPAQCPLV